MFCKSLCIKAALVLLVSRAAAQEQPRRSAQAVRGGPMFGTAIELFRNVRVRDQVREELAISQEQAKQIDEAFQRVNDLNGDFWEAQSLDPDARQKRMREIFKQGADESKLAEEKLNRVLKPEQRARWKQLWLQWQGAAVLLQPAVAKDLGLTDAQQDKLREIAASLRPQLGERKLEDFSQQERQQFFAELNARREKAQLDMVAVLSEDQKTSFAEMKGQEFPFPPRRLGSSADQPDAKGGKP